MARFSFVKIILVHNGSEPKHLEAVKAAFPHIDHLVLPKNLGFTGGANTGLDYVFKFSDWCLFLTNDCQLEDVGTLPKEPAFVAPKIFSRKTQNIDSIGGFFEPQKAKIIHCRDAKTFYPSRLRKYVPGTAFIMHRQIFEKTNGFDPSLFMYWEDVDLSQRVLDSGFPILIDENWQIRHAIGKTCHKNPLYTLFYYQRNRWRVSKRYCSLPQKVILYGYYFKDILRIALKLIHKKRYTDFTYLIAAIRDS